MNFRSTPPTVPTVTALPNDAVLLFEDTVTAPEEVLPTFVIVPELFVNDSQVPF